MKILLLYSALFWASCLWSQNFLNGNFEQNTFVTCSFDMSNDVFNANVVNTVAFGLGFCDLQTNDCSYAPVVEGNWFLSIDKSVDDQDRVSLELSQNLVAGSVYTVRFWDRSDLTFEGVVIADLQIGLSSENNSFGTQIYSGLPEGDIWVKRQFSFTAPISGQYITLRPNPEGEGDCWTFVDEFEIFEGLGTSENRQTKFAIYPNPSSGEFSINAPFAYDKVSVYDNLGRLVEAETSSGKFRIYQSGVYVVRLKSEFGESVQKLVVL